MENTFSEEEYCNEIEEKLSKRKRFGIDDEDFVEILQFYPCLLDKSQTPAMKIKKQEALQGVEENIKKYHDIELNTSQIRKKIENMKARVKTKVEKKKRGSSSKIFKAHEEKLLGLMGYKNNSAWHEMHEQCDVQSTSKDSDDDEDVTFQEAPLTGPSSSIPQFQHIVLTPKRRTPNYQCSVYELQKEVLIEQKELNKQQKELNIKQMEIFGLDKQRLLLEIDLLKKKLALESSIKLET